MPEGEAPPAPIQPQESSRGSSQSRRNRGRSGRGRGSQPNGATQRGGRSAAPQQNRDSSTAAPEPTPIAQGSTPSSNSRASRGGRSRRGRRGGGESSVQQPEARHLRAGPSRTFGGHLTVDASESSSAALALSLSADAPEFVPGQPLVTRRKSAHVSEKRTEHQTKFPKSTATDLGTRIHEDISNANYECAVCTDEVLRTSHVWSCSVCWAVVHLKCAKKWHHNQMKQESVQSSQPQRESTWRCPGCNSKLSDEPSSYHCWCGKDVSPKPSSTSVPPHSCGQTCSKPRGTCPHPCPLQCHAGPCPPCGLTGPTQSCYCGKNTSRKLCRETDYENGWSCQEICGDLLPCGDHFCPSPCHPGLCGDCDLKIDARCYCGRIQKRMPCYEQEEPQESFNSTEETWFEGVFNCERLCERNFDCGIHKCSEACHPQDEQPAHCPYSPDMVTTCPCGKTPLGSLLSNARETCKDEIPHCERPCEKLLPCGHLCSSKCHDGDCGSCLETVEILCRCGRVPAQSICHQGNIQHPLCMRTCQATLSCGRHKCGEHCCSGEKRAIERQAAKRKHKLPGQVQAIEAEHICIKACGRLLKCGSHTCQQMCHRGPCGSCPEAIFHEISCDCGRTVLQPPQPCGTRAPDCRFNCLRRPACGHPPVEHNCHADDISCPKCPFLVDKWCACGKEKLHSQPCHIQAAHCGRPCGKKLNCGLHSCKKLCHRPGECDEGPGAGQRCAQVCGKTKLFCNHACQNNCHGQTPCNESAACTAKAAVTCPCGLRRQEVRCLASSSNTDPLRPEIKCDDECLRQERNRRLATALNIDPTSHTNDHVPYSDVTLRLFKDNTSWAETQEREFRVFSKSPDEARLRYKPMSSSQRQFLHALAEDYGLESKSEDVEPYRYVVVFKGTRFVSAPSKTLAQCVKIRETQAAEAAITSSRAPSPPVVVVSEPYNAFILTSPRFGLTTDDVNSALKSDLASQSSLHFTVNFLPSEEVLIRATAHYSSFLTPTAVEQALTALKPRLDGAVKRLDVAGNILLCHVDNNDHVSRRGDLSRQDASGWSAVASRATKRDDSKTEEPLARGSGKKMLGLRRKKVESNQRETPWASQLDGDVEC